MKNSPVAPNKEDDKGERLQACRPLPGELGSALARRRRHNGRHGCSRAQGRGSGHAYR